MSDIIISESEARDLALAEPFSMLTADEKATQLEADIQARWLPLSKRRAHD